ncbi:Tc toxin subunit A-related protein [Paenibacillus mendelii]|uniref:Neuraminidase-like domain-containing protein n=1 Tax=Paenibacillus mendelii TaxID=206163 RepID=A0ABV6JFE8_9BACL|nr:neuraminidase-like domain-containing protein [Paenibacillus mendelii]MCQ6557500.1 neuraminidase-like domain-containing protein [Paenibacillus mendelii]
MKLPGRQLSKNVQNYDVKLLQRALGKLKFPVSEQEHAQGILGATTQQAVAEFQKTHRLQQTGELDESTLAKLKEAIAAREAAKPVQPAIRHLKVDYLNDIARIRYPVRLNMAKDTVGDLQKTLSFLKIDIDMREAEQKRFGTSTREAVKKFQEQQGLAITGEVDKRTAEKLNQVIVAGNPAPLSGEDAYRIRGSIRNELWQGRQGIKVQLYEKSIRGEKLLGERESLINGFYDLKYEPPKNGKTVKPVVIKLIDSQGNVLKTETIANPGKVAWVNYTEGNLPFVGISEIEKLVKALQPELGELKLEQLEESAVHQDLTYLAKHTGKSAEEIMKLALSSRMGAKSGLAPEICYAFLRQNLPVSLPGALIESTQQWQLIDRLVENTLAGVIFMDEALQKQAIESAVRSNYVPRTLLVNLAAVIIQLNQLRTNYTLNSAFLTGNANLKSVLEHSKLQAAGFNRFSELYAEHRGTTGEFWLALESDAGTFPEPVVSDLKKTFAVAAVAKNHLPTVNYMKQIIADPRDLAKLSREDWAAHIRANMARGGQGYPDNVDGGDETEKINGFAAILKSKAEDLYPTVSFLAAAASPAVDTIKYGDELLTMSDKQPEFDLRRTNIDQFLKEKGREAELREEAVTELKKMQRAFKMAPNVNTGIALLKQSWHSSAHVYFQGKNRFAEKFAAQGFTKLESRKVYDLASRNYAMLLAKASEYRAEFQQLTPKAILPWTMTQDQQKQIQDFPSLEALFGSLDYCACKDCRSVYSPAAYMVDIIRFLNEKDAVKAGSSAKHVLLQRRPDIGDLELSCENTNIALPYIDLVNELLEEAVAPLAAFVPFNLPGGLVAALDAREITVPLRNAFVPPLTNAASIETKEPGVRWTIAETAFRYQLKLKDGVLRVMSRSRQTSGSAVELAANPQYVRAEAYKKLLSQVYPWSLPFHLWQEETRVYLAHLGTKRDRLAEAFSTHAERNAALNDKDHAREFLGLTPVSWAIVTGARTVVDGVDLSVAPPWSFWGFPSEDVTLADPTDPDTTLAGKWHQLVTRVDLLLQRSGFMGGLKENGGGYKRLLELLDTHYVNPLEPGSSVRQLVIESLDPADPLTCTLRKLVLKANAPTAAERELRIIAALDRMHRFVRLAGTTGCGFRELDRVMRVLMQSDGLSDPFLIRLSHVKRQQLEWSVPLPAILSWWNNMETSIYASLDGEAAETPIYDRLLRNKAVMNPLDEAFELNAARSELLHPHAVGNENPLTAHKPALLAAFGLSEPDLNLFIERIQVADEMNLGNLSLLYRHVSMAKVLKVSIRDYITIRELSAVNPFAFPSTASAITFIEQSERMRLSGMSAADLDWLLRHKRPLESSLAPSNDRIAAILIELLRALRTIADENPDSDGSALDPNGDVTRKKLEQLAWSPAVTDPFMAMLGDAAVFEASLDTLPSAIRLRNDNGAYEAELNAMPQGIVIPESLQGRLSYDDSSRKLRLVGILTPDEKQLLLDASADAPYRQAIGALASEPARLRGAISYDAANKKLRFTGAMTEARRSHLLENSADALYQTAVQQLFNEPRSFVRRNLRSFRLTHYAAFLESKPAGLEFPASLRSKLYYDAPSSQLRSVGAIGASERIQLLALYAEENYARAVMQLESWPDSGTFIQSSVYLSELPEHVVFPDNLRPKLHYDLTAKQLRFLGVMSDAEKSMLLTLAQPADHAFRSAVEALQVKSVEPRAAEEPFLAEGDIASLFDGDRTPAERYGYVLGKLLPHIRGSLSVMAVKQKLGEALKLDSAITELLLTRYVQSPAGPAADPALKRPAIAAFLEPSYVGSSPNTRLTPAGHPGVFQTYTLLAKFAAVILRWKLTPELIVFVCDRANAGGWLHPGSLPGSDTETAAADATAAFTAWLKLSAVIELRDRLPITEAELIAVMSVVFALDGGASEEEKLSAKRSCQRMLTEAAGWPAADLAQLLGQPDNLADNGMLGIAFPAGFREPAALLRLCEVMQWSKKLGVEPVTARSWTNANPGPLEAASLKQAVKAKYEDSQWLTIARTLRDPLREKQRDALVSYLIAQHPLAWDSVNDLYAYFLLDVEMGPQQMTSRLKQSISSVQLFVQRCLMNLEGGEVIAKESDGWDQWKWMKNYRVWEANRKVFLYPENWTEPELRDDKSEFFKALESDISQNDITSDHVETAYLTYLDKLDEVARLDICSMYHEVEGTRNVVHVLARTKATPAVYYYRRYIDNSYWTGWEKIDLEIDTDHATLAVHNRKLHIFWPVFTEMLPKRQIQPPATELNAPKRAPESPKYWEIKLAWSVKKNGAWTPKKLSKRKLIHPWERPTTSYHLKPRLRSGYLWIDLFISTSREFNDTEFYYPDDNKWATKTSIRFNETARPWHSSSFVYNGDVIDVYMKNLVGSVSDGINRHFGEDGRLIKLLGFDHRSPHQLLPAGMHYRNTHLVNNTQVLNLDDLNVLTNHGLRVDDGRLLDSANAPFSLVITQQDTQFDSASRPFFYQDLERSYFIKPMTEYRAGNYFTTDLPSDPGNTQYRIRYTMYPFYHPYTTLFIRELNRTGIPGLLSRKVQTEPQTIPPVNSFDFDYEYRPLETTVPWESARKEVVDFSIGGAYALYNWELFFHAPLMIATRLSQNQRFEEAMQWFHYIFDPTCTDNQPVPQKYWKTKPFYEYNEADYRNQRIDNLLKLVNSGSPEYEKQVEMWREDPFKPHLIARLRPIAYQRTVVMKYIDNLVAWADQEFRRDTLESINEATLLYVLAEEILGRRPERVPSAYTVEDLSYAELEQKLDAFGNALVEVENLLPPPVQMTPGNGGIEQLPRLETFYFGIPHNDKLVEYWNTVEDRLFKIRHSLNIDGKFRQLPLFEPPIDPALLVKAAAAGVDIGSVLNDLNAPHPNYRFPIMLQKAKELCEEVKALGSQLLAVLEKSDAEALALLRMSHETKLLEQIRHVKLQAVKEQEATLLSLEKSKEAADQKIAYYTNLPFMNAWEVTALSLSGASTVLDTAIAAGYIMAGGLKLIPNFTIGASGFGGSPTATAETGGDKFGDAAENMVQTMSAIAQSLEKMAGMASTVASYHRRKEEWDQQKALAVIEGAQIDQQMEASRIRIAMSQRELGNHDLQIEQAKSVQQFMHSKFTNLELYQWMKGQLATLYFQSYQLAYDIAKRAEKAFRYELGLQDSSYIQFGYWDSLKKGLLAGDKLAHDLNRLDAAYYEQNARQLEIVKHVSLAIAAPFSLMKLKETGACLVELPEWLFDLDYPGHYMRRLKSVGISIPCVTGPLTSVNCTLSLVSSSTRISGTAGSAYVRAGIDDGRFTDQYGLSRAIATSSGDHDSGVFELSFNDERYLPFEGAGAVSLWRIEMPHDCNAIDFSTVSDVVMHVHYTARDGGAALASAARSGLQTILPQQGVRIFNLKQEFPSEWYRFIHPVQQGADQLLNITFEGKHVPFFDRHKAVKVTALHVIAPCQGETGYTLSFMPPSGAGMDAMALAKDYSYGAAHHGEKTFAAGSEPDLKGAWTFKLKADDAADDRSLQPDDVDGVYLIVQYRTN